MPSVPSTNQSIISLQDARLDLGGRRLWRSLTLSVAPGEFLTVLGPNGSGKTTFLRTLLGLQSLTSGTVKVLGRRPRRGSREVGYIPQLQAFDPDLPIRGRDLVRLGLDGHRLGFRGGAAETEIVRRQIALVHAEKFADAPLGRLSGGEQQRLRVAQALVGDPRLLLCDEPLLSLDLSQQRGVSGLIDDRRRTQDTAVVFVTHDINPVLPLTDRVLYLANGSWAVGTPQEVLTSETLSDLYSTPVEVLRIKGRIIVIGAGEALHTEPGVHQHHHGARRA